MPLLLFFGGNQTELEEAVEEGRRAFEDADALILDAIETPLASIAEAALTPGLFAERRLVILKDLHQRPKAFGKDAATEEIRLLLRNIAPATTLLLDSHDLPTDHALIKEVREAGGEIRTFQLPRRYELPKWIMARAKKRGVRITAEAAEVLSNLVGSNTVMLESELEKLAVYAGSETIDPQTVEALVGPINQGSIFALVDAIASGDKGKALELLQVHMEEASTTPTDGALHLIRMLARHMRVLLSIHLRQDENQPTSRIISDLRLPRYYADRYFRQAKRLPVDRLRNSFELLASLEYRLKSSMIDPAAGTSLLVAELAG